LTWKTALKGQECPQKKWADIKISRDEDKSAVAEGVD